MIARLRQIAAECRMITIEPLLRLVEEPARPCSFCEAPAAFEVTFWSWWDERGDAFDFDLELCAECRAPFERKP